MDFKLNVNNDETTHVQFDDLMNEIRQHLAQWNNFEDVSRPVIIMVGKQPNNTPTLGVSSNESLDVYDVFGGLPEAWPQEQKDLYLKIVRIAEEQGEEAARDYLRNQGQ